MINDSIKQSVQATYQTIANKMEKFRKRYTQRLLIAEIAKTISGSRNEKILIAEGPTGTGKTLAYLVAAIPIANALKKSLVISSGTVALQSQILLKDIPTLLKLTDLNFDYTIAKGRARYLCPNRLIQLAGDSNEQTDAFSRQDYLHDTLRELYGEFQSGDWDGDKDSLPNKISDEIWQKVSTDRHGCLAARCRHISICPYFIAKSKLENADVIIANHDLVLSDLSLGGGVLLPDPEDTIYIFDEAHHLPEKTINHAGTWISLNGSISWLDKVETTLNQIEFILESNKNKTHLSNCRKSVAQLIEALKQSRDLLSSLDAFKQSLDPEVTLRFPMGIIPDALRQQSKELQQYSQDCLNHFNKIKDKISQRAKDDPDIMVHSEQVLPDLGILIGRLENSSNLWTIFSIQDAEKSPPYARWITRNTFKDNVDFRISTSPISAEEFLYQNLWSRCYSAVLTSATLVALGSFSYFQKKIGLQHSDSAHYLQLTSPFNLQENAVLWIPWMASQPSQIQEHTNELIKLLPDMIDFHSGTLVLFSSRKQLTNVAEELPLEVQQNLLIQGDLNTNALIEKHRENISQDKPSIIFGLASFAEGIDLPGKLCTHVIIAKLPFPVPDSPVDATEREYISAQGKNHFQEMVLPQTSIKLIQAVGRLIRNESDTGKVTILDRRLVDKSYGRQLLSALPPMRQIIDKKP